MDFVTPDQYTKSNLAHYEINRRAASELRRLVGSGLGPQDRLLDFGCGTGESTVALAEGDLGDLGAPGQVVGVDSIIVSLHTSLIRFISLPVFPGGTIAHMGIALVDPLLHLVDECFNLRELSELHQADILTSIKDPRRGQVIRDY